MFWLVWLLMQPLTRLADTLGDVTFQLCAEFCNCSIQDVEEVKTDDLSPLTPGEPKVNSRAWNYILARMSLRLNVYGLSALTQSKRWSHGFETTCIIHHTAPSASKAFLRCVIPHPTCCRGSVFDGRRRCNRNSVKLHHHKLTPADA